jgi:hypothetical protein
MPDEPDGDLLRSFVQGDRDAFESLFIRFEVEVYRWTLSIVPPQRSAEYGARSEIGQKTSSLNERTPPRTHSPRRRFAVRRPRRVHKVLRRIPRQSAPETFPERQYAQTVIHTQWRLNRVRVGPRRFVISLRPKCLPTALRGPPSPM